jgi:hypothetical protein
LRLHDFTQGFPQTRQRADVYRQKDRQACRMAC